MTHVTRRWDRRRALTIAVATAATVLLTVTLLSWSAKSWADTKVAAAELLPGTTVAGVTVGGATLDDAHARVTQALDAQLDRSVVVRHEDEVWSVSLRDLGGTIDVESGLRTALTGGAESSILDLIRVRWFGSEAPIVVRVPIRVPPDRFDGFVASIADTLDSSPRSADLVWDGEGPLLVPAEDGLEVDRSTTSQGLLTALRGGTDEVVVTADILGPELDTRTATAAADLVRGPLDAVLDREVRVVHGDEGWATSARELEAIPDLGPLFAAAVETVREDRGSSPALDDAGVPLDVDEETLSSFLEGIAATIDVAPRNARLDHSTGWIEFIPGRAGTAVDRELAAGELLAALRGAAETVHLEIGPWEPRVTLDDLRHVLLVRQGERRVYLYRDGRIVRDWPVAVGLAGSPTPTGTFTIGAKRGKPTWYNPSPTGWGRDMPAVIGPGPDNPLGLRALNWNRDGRDTLIRFHGTPNEGSIGEAASRGCVRLRNADVVEMFDLVPSGATVVSLNVGTPPAPEPVDVIGDADDDAEGADEADV